MLKVGYRTGKQFNSNLSTLRSTVEADKDATKGESRMTWRRADRRGGVGASTLTLIAYTCLLHHGTQGSGESFPSSAFSAKNVPLEGARHSRPGGAHDPYRRGGWLSQPGALTAQTECNWPGIDQGRYDGPSTLNPMPDAHTDTTWS